MALQIQHASSPRPSGSAEHSAQSPYCLSLLASAENPIAAATKHLMASQCSRFVLIRKVNDGQAQKFNQGLKDNSGVLSELLVLPLA